MADIPTNGTYVTWRDFGRLENTIRDDREERRRVDEKLDMEKADRGQVDRIEEKLGSMQKTMLAFSFSAIFAGLSFIIGVLTLVGH